MNFIIACIIASLRISCPILLWRVSGEATRTHVSFHVRHSRDFSWLPQKASLLAGNWIAGMCLLQRLWHCYHKTTTRAQIARIWIIIMPGSQLLHSAGNFYHAMPAWKTRPVKVHQCTRIWVHDLNGLLESSCRFPCNQVERKFETHFR